MIVTDPIADLLTRIRNANQMRYKEVVVPSSKMKLEIVKILKDEGYITDYKVEKNEVQDNIVFEYDPVLDTSIVAGAGASNCAKIKRALSSGFSAHNSKSSASEKIRYWLVDVWLITWIDFPLTFIFVSGSLS